MSTDRELGKRIRAVRQQNGLSLREAAKTLGIGLQTLVRYEKASGAKDSRFPPADFLLDLLALPGSGGLNPTWLLTGEGVPFHPIVGDYGGIEGSLSELKRRLPALDRQPGLNDFHRISNPMLLAHKIITDLSKSGPVLIPVDLTPVADTLHCAVRMMTMLRGYVDGVREGGGVEIGGRPKPSKGR